MFFLWNYWNGIEVTGAADVVVLHGARNGSITW
jgi:hypothetical protein